MAKKLEFLGSSGFAGAYVGDFSCEIGKTSPWIDDKKAEYLLKKMPGCWKLIDSKPGAPAQISEEKSVEERKGK